MSRPSKRQLRSLAAVSLVTGSVLLVVALIGWFVGAPLQLLLLLAIVVIMIGAAAVYLEKQRN